MVSHNVSGVVTPVFTTYSGVEASGVSATFIFPTGAFISVIGSDSLNFPVYGTGVAGGGSRLSNYRSVVPLLLNTLDLI